MSAVRERTNKKSSGKIKGKKGKDDIINPEGEISMASEETSPEPMNACSYTPRKIRCYASDRSGAVVPIYFDDEPKDITARMHGGDGSRETSEQTRI